MSGAFPKSAPLRLGYRPEQVDRHFETTHEIYDVGELNEMDSEGVRTVAFDVVLHGYQPQAMDTALDRLEAASLQRRRAASVARNGRQAQMGQVAQLATTLYPRLPRSAGGHLASTSGQGHGKADVDTLMDRIADYFDSGTTLASNEVRGAVLRHTRGNKAYDESGVDRYLVCVIEVFPSVE